MQTNETTTSTVSTVAAAQPVPSIETVAAITNAETAQRKALAAKLAAKREAANGTDTQPAKPAKAANAKNAAKRVAAKPAAIAKPAKPTNEAREAVRVAQSDAHRLARSVAAQAVAEFYSGSSKPFKAASDRFADINTSNAKSATVRQAGLALALITYGAGNMLSTGEFVRGAFVVPAKLVNPNAKPGDTIRAQPESGCLGNMLSRACDYVRGPTTGKAQIDATYRLRPTVVIAEIRAAFGDKRAEAAAKLLASYPAKRAA